MTRVLLGLAVCLGLATIVVHQHDRVTAAQLTAWRYDRRAGLRIIDLRPDSTYIGGHIPGAEHMSLSQLRRAGFRSDETIVLYSDGAAPALEGWLLLRASGLPHVYSLRGGAGEWADRRRWRGGC